MIKETEQDTITTPSTEVLLEKQTRRALTAIFVFHAVAGVAIYGFYTVTQPAKPKFNPEISATSSIALTVR